MSALQSRGLGAAFLVLLAAFPFLVDNPYYVHLLIVIGIYTILVFGLDIVVGYTGEVSLGHAGLFGIGSYTAGTLYFQLGMGFWPSIPIAIAVTALFGLILALPALRVTGPYLAMVTLAFGTIIQILINEMTFLTNGPMGIPLKKVALAGLLEPETEYYYVVIAFVVLTLVVVNRILRSHWGRAFEALRDSPIASDCMAVSVYRYKVYAFVVSAGLAGLAGSLFTYSELYISPNTYSFELTVLFLLAVTMGGRKSRLGPIIGSAIIVILPNVLADIDLFRIIAGVFAALALGITAYGYATKSETRERALIPTLLCVAFFVFSLFLEKVTDYRLTIFGMMILFVVYYLPDGIVGFLRQRFPALRPKPVSQGRGISSQGAVAVSDVAKAPKGEEGGDTLLDAQAILMQFGGLKALDQVDLKVKPGTVHGLIGPNGSGKSTMMNVLTGIYRPTAGRVALVGNDLAGLSPAMIAGRGIARTFQNVQLFGEMTALENVLVGLHHTYNSTLWDIILTTGRQRREEDEARARAKAILEFMGLGSLADEQARNLPYGKQRLLEIGRAIALDPTLLLLDEPAAGLTAPDIKELIAIIKKIRDAGITIILIEHHMDVVMSICDTVTVLDFGQKIAEGTPAEVQRNPRVIEAYLGGAAAVAE